MSDAESEGYARNLIEQVAEAVPIHVEQWVRQNAGAAAAKGQLAEGWPQVGLTNELIVAILDLCRPLPPLPPPNAVLYVYHVNRGAPVHMVDRTPEVEEEMSEQPWYCTAKSRCGEEPDNHEVKRVDDPYRRYPSGKARAWGIVPLQAPPVHVVCVVCRRNVNPFKVEDEQAAQ